MGTLFVAEDTLGMPPIVASAQPDPTVVPRQQDEPTLQGTPVPVRKPVAGSFANTGFMMSPLGNSEAEGPAPPPLVEGKREAVQAMRPLQPSLRPLPEDLSGFNSFSGARPGAPQPQAQPFSPLGHFPPAQARAAPGPMMPGGMPAPGMSPMGVPASGMSPMGMPPMGMPASGAQPRAPLAPSPAASAMAAPLSLVQLACMVAELDIDAGRAPQVFGANGVDAATYERQRAQLEIEMAGDDAKLRRFEQLRDYYRAILGSR